MKVSNKRGRKPVRGKNKVQQGNIKTRKELRKDKRKEKKSKKHDFFQRKKTVSGKSVTTSTSDMNDRKSGHPTKFQSAPNPTPSKEVLPKKETKGDGFIKHQILEKEKQKLRQQKLEREMKKNRQIQLKQANRDEDKVIKKLEKQLKLNKRKSKSVPKSFATDGLDYLLEVCDEDKIRQAVELEQNLHESGSEFEEDFAMVTGKVTKKPKADAHNGKTLGSDGEEGNFESEVSDGEEGNFENQPSDGEEDNFESEPSDGKEDMGSLFEDGEKSFQGSYSDNEFSEDASDVDQYQFSSQRNVKHKTVTSAESKEKSSEMKLKKMKRKLTDSDRASEAISKKKSKNNSVIHSNESSPISDHTKSKNKKKCKSNESELAQKANKGSKRNKNSGNDVDELPSEGGKFVRLKNITNDNSGSVEKGIGKKNPKSVRFALLDEVSDDDYEEEDHNNEDSMEESENKEYWEDIYGRTRDKKGNVVQVSVGKYIPPQLRAQAASVDAKKQEQLQRLRKQMKGLVNRLAENNMNSIATQLDELYMTNSRNDMNETLTALLLESMVAPILTPERLVMEHVMLVAILHANVGTEVGAHFLQAVIKKFDDLYQEEFEVENKEVDNIILIISHLYNFKVFNSLLMYNILEKLAATFGPKEVELILLVLRSVGFSLRRDDPLALKGLVLQLQQKASEASRLQSDPRVQFMLDILLAIKNNNMVKIPNYDPSHSEHLKKLLKGFLRKGNYVTELKISLEDLLKAEERGRWWVVGSAWTGLLPGESPGEAKGEVQQGRSTPPTQSYSQQLLELARKQRMNTDVRRNIFCILMTAEDYLDAFEKLLHLGLKNQQEREIIHVILDCCLHEKEFNPYYGHLTQKFCDFDRKYQMILQFTLWDKFKEVQNLLPSQVRNLAHLLVHLFVEKGLPISVLKVVHFAEVDKAMVRLLRQVLLGTLLYESLEAMQEVFQRVSIAPKLHMFRESLRLFIQHFLLRKTDSLPPQDVQTLKDRANIVNTILSMADSREKFF